MGTCICVLFNQKEKNFFIWNNTEYEIIEWWEHDQLGLNTTNGYLSHDSWGWPFHVVPLHEDSLWGPWQRRHMSVVASWSIPADRSVEVHTDGCIGAFWVHWVRSSRWSFLRWVPGLCVRTVCLQVVHWVTICAPAVPYEGLVVERPRMNPI